MLGPVGGASACRLARVRKIAFCCALCPGAAINLKLECRAAPDEVIWAAAVQPILDAVQASHSAQPGLLDAPALVAKV